MYRRKHWGNNVDNQLRVREVIMPKRNGCGADFIKPDNVASQPGISGAHEIHGFCGLALAAVEKPLLEDYVPGIQKKKCRKRKKNKRKEDKDYSPFCDFSLSNEMFQSREDEEKDSHPKVETLEEKLSKGKIKRKIQVYENWVEQEHEKNQRKQRQLKNRSMEWQENLAETWLGYIERRKELRRRRLEEGIPSPRYNHRLYNRPVNISLISKKFWNDDADGFQKKLAIEKIQKPAKPEKRKEISEASLSPVRKLEHDFFEKLVFIDDSDSEVESQFKF